MEKKKKDVINRLKRAEGQLRGIQKMIEEEKECIDIVTQLVAVRSSINSLTGLVIANKIQSCFENPSANPKEQEERLKEAIKMIVKK